MGLQGQLNDVGSDSIPLYLVALIAASLSHLRSLVAALLRPLSSASPDSPSTLPGSEDLSFVGSGLADLILLSEHLTLNRDLSYAHSSHSHSPPSVCVVCLSGVRDGDRVRKLPCCRHVFHKDCFDGWIHHMNFNCPLCRTPVAIHDHRRLSEPERRRVADSALSWFAVR